MAVEGGHEESGGKVGVVGVDVLLQLMISLLKTCFDLSLTFEKFEAEHLPKLIHISHW